MWSTFIAEARSGHGEDKIGTFPCQNGMIVVVADGAGGTSGGASAAEYLCKKAAAEVPTDWTGWLMRIDHLMAASAVGLATVVVAEITDDGSIVGASIGDCEAWVLGDGEPRSLTENQNRKPLIGSGDAVPVSFSAQVRNGTLVIGTDGLWKYARRTKILETAVMVRPLDIAAEKLVDAARLKNGKLQDDVAVFIYAAKGTK